MIRERLRRFRELMARYGTDYFVVADQDPHSCEYPAGHWKARSWLSGFTGSNGVLVVTRDEALLWTDGRYYIQAENQLAGSSIELMRAGEPGTPAYPEWIAGKVAGAGANLGPSSADRPGEADAPRCASVGVDGRVTSCAAYNELKKALANSNARIVTGRDPVGELWRDGRPEIPAAPVFNHELRHAGKPSSEKIACVRAEMGRRGVNHALICGLEDVAWLFNIRGADIPHLPVAYSRALILPDAAELYIDLRKLPAEVAAALSEQGVAAFDADGLAGRLEGLGKGDSIGCDAGKLCVWLRDRVPEGVRVDYAEEPTILLKAVKNDTELRGHREAQLQDGAAMVRFMIWAEKEADAGRKFTEWDVSLTLTRLRAQNAGCLGDSFSTIAGYGPNGAMMHYAPREDACSEIKDAGLMVVDSGGQYPGGTTDVTRTVAFKNTTPEERADFTLTLKAHIALASARFLYGAAGCHVDSIARKVMWDRGLDYKCGTGHGVGCYLSVHEGPHSISMRAPGGARLEENMIVSIEPGVYREGKHGVRIENLARIMFDMENEFGRFLRFEILSFCPIQLDGVEPDMLGAPEKDWLNNYHREVYEKISPLLDDAERAWLSNATRPI